MIIRAGVADRNRTRVPVIINRMLAFAIRRSPETGLVFNKLKVVIEGSMTVNNTMFTPALNDKSSPAYFEVIRGKDMQVRICKYLLWTDSTRICSRRIAREY